MATLPPDLQKIVRDNAVKVTKEILPFVKEFLAQQTNVWKSKGGLIVDPPAAEKAAVTAKISTIATDLSKDKPDLAAAVKVAFDAAARLK